MNDQMVRSQVIYARDHKGQTRIWSYLVSGDQWCTISGLIDGKRTQSKWKTEKSKGVGKAKTTPEQQALLAAESAMTRNLKTDYQLTIEDLDKPKYFPPMLAKPFKEFEGECWSEPKLDGHRMIAPRKGVFSRTGEPIFTVPHIRLALTRAFTMAPRLIFDGELYNHDFHDRFEELSGLISKKNVTPEILEQTAGHIQYHIYDVFDPARPTLNRQARLELIDKYVEECEYIRHVPCDYVRNADELDLLYNRYLSNNYEGQMVRTIEGAYEQSPLDYRSDNLRKRKEVMSAEFEITDVHQGSGNWGGVAKTVSVRLASGLICSATLKGTREYALKVWELRQSLIGTMATVDFFNYTTDGMLRFPRVRVIDRKDLKL